MKRHVVALVLAMASLGRASDVHAAESTAATDDDTAPAPVVLRHIPPRFSWNAGVSASYGMLTQFPQYPAGGGFGARGEWGKHFDAHRVGVGLSITVEGTIPIQWSNNFEPYALWDWVSPKGLYLGATLGPDLIINSDIGGTRKIANTFAAAPSVAFRIGYSQPWSLVAKRFSVYLEPKLRVINGRPNIIGSLVLGSGRGY